MHMYTTDEIFHLPDHLTKGTQPMIRYVSYATHNKGMFNMWGDGPLTVHQCDTLCQVRESVPAETGSHAGVNESKAQEQVRVCVCVYVSL